jgi:anti-sigma-K factor RskA
MSHEEYQELLAAHALTALDAADARALATHLDSCDECRSQTVNWEETAAMLAFAADPVEPSARVRENILAALRNEPQNVGATGAQQTASQVLPFERPAKLQRSPLASFAAIAATVALIALSISLLFVWKQKRANDLEVARLNSEMRKSQEQLQHEREVVSLITSPGAHMAELAGTNAAPGAHAMIAYDKDGQAMLMAKGLPAAPAGKAYQLWFIKDGKKMPGKVFKTDPSGAGMLKDQMPAEALSAAVFAITLEPESGVQVPTGAVYLVSGS